METLNNDTVHIRTEHGDEEYRSVEKDYGDLVVYDIFCQDRYLLTMAADGSILFMNFDAEEKDKEIFKITQLNVIIEKIKAHA